MNRLVLLTTLIVGIKSGSETVTELPISSPPAPRSEVLGATAFSFYLAPDTVNVNTVIFKDSDLRKSCWNVEDIVLLATRHQMQGLVPKKMPENITTLLDYYKLSLETINLVRTDEGFKKKLLLSAFADAIGGYMKHVAIPMTNEAYYSGNIDYEVAKQMHELYDSVKLFLMTTGDGWQEPRSFDEVTSVRVRPLDLNVEDGQDACTEFVKPRSVKGGTAADLLPIPMPYLDDEKNPNSIALPFRFRSLFSLENGNTTNALLQYYDLGLSCLASSYNEGDVQSFNSDIRSWVLKSVVPHLQETKWYPGFWGVMKIVETVKRLESKEIRLPTTRRIFISDLTEAAVATPSTRSVSQLSNVNTTLATVIDNHSKASLLLRKTPPDPNFRNVTYHCGSERGWFTKMTSLTTRALLAAALICALILLIPFLLYHFLYALCGCGGRSGSQQSLPEESDMELLNTLVALYWELRESNARRSQKQRRDDSVETGTEEEDEDSSVSPPPKFQNHFKDYWKRKRKCTPPVRRKETPPKLSYRRSVRFESPSVETMLPDCTERIIQYEDRVYRSE